MASVDVNVLRSLPLLEGADAEVLQALAHAATQKDFGPGQVILEEGASGREVYLIVAGLVEVVKGQESEETVLARRGPGDFLGEMGLIEGSPRFATVRALEPSRLLVISERDLREVLAGNPEMVYEATRVLSSRLRHADLQMIADLQRKNRELARAYRELKEAQVALLEKERLEHELELARELQESILPQSFPDTPEASFAASNRPARQVGGDFYDVFPVSGDSVGLVIADVSDKGLAAALYMALSRSLIRAEAGHHVSPRDVLVSTNELLLQMTQASMFVTVFYGVLEPGTGRLCYARAGHDYPVLFRPATGECRFLRGRGTVLGCVGEVGLEEVNEELCGGDMLCLYTDGVTDANSPAGELLGRERLRETISATEKMSAAEACDFILQSVDRFRAGAAQYDDMALLVVKLS